MRIGHHKEFRKIRNKFERDSYSAQSDSIRISLRWPIHIIKPDSWWNQIIQPIQPVWFRN